MRKLTREEIMDLLSAPEATDEPEESDFYDDGFGDDFDDEAEEEFIEDWLDDWIEKELN